MMCESLPNVKINGNILERDSQRFFVRGLVYTSHGDFRGKGKYTSQDPLQDDCIDTLKQDIILFNELGINTLFVYTFDPDLPHERSIGQLSNAGIYLVISLSDPRNSINRMKPRETYTTDLLAYYCRKIDALSKFQNIMAVCIANGIINNHVQPDAEAVIREVIRKEIRDLKSHMRVMKSKNGHRILPLCINDSGALSRLAASLNYHTSPSEPDAALDLYMFTNYECCEKKNSKWEQMASYFAHSSLPILISEFGCNSTRPRQFNEVDRLYSAELKTTFSGGFVYEYQEGANRYGLVKIDETGTIRKLPDFENLKRRLQHVGSL